MGKISMKRSTKKQKQIIHILEHQLIMKGRLDEKGYRLVLMGLFGKESSRDLSNAEASRLIDQLLKMGGEIMPAQKRGSHVQRIPAVKFDEPGSLEGLRHEVIQLAKERYGEEFEKPLAALCRKLHINDYTSMDVRHAKAVKETLLRLRSEGPYTSKKK
jgi:Bacteriophage Mu, GemA protein